MRRQIMAEDLAERLYNDPVEIIPRLRAMPDIANQHDLPRILIVVDQFEELFTAVSDSQEL